MLRAGLVELLLKLVCARRDLLMCAKKLRVRRVTLGYVLLISRRCLKQLSPRAVRFHAGLLQLLPKGENFLFVVSCEQRCLFPVILNRLFDFEGERVTLRGYLIPRALERSNLLPKSRSRRGILLDCSIELGLQRVAFACQLFPLRGERLRIPLPPFPLRMKLFEQSIPLLRHRIAFLRYTIECFSMFFAQHLHLLLVSLARFLELRS